MTKEPGQARDPAVGALGGFLQENGLHIGLGRGAGPGPGCRAGVRTELGWERLRRGGAEVTCGGCCCER